MSACDRFGQFFKEKRQANQYTLRTFCKKYKLDPGNISKMERGRLSPPSSQSKLENYTKFLNIKKGSDDWYEFFDLAAACRGEIPKDVMEDEDLVARLPLVFRTLRGQKPTSKDLNEIINIIKRS